LLDVESSKAFV